MDYNQQLLHCLAEKREEMRRQYHRVLPVGELLFNRFEKAEYLGFGEQSSVYDTSVVMGDVHVGKHVWIGPYTIVEGINGRVSIGDFVSLNAGVSIYTHDSTKYYVSGGACAFEKGDVNIGSNTVIGSMSIICHGVSVGSGCVVGAHSMVTKDVPDGAIVAGVPARRIGSVRKKSGGQVEFLYDEGERE